MLIGFNQKNSLNFENALQLADLLVRALKEPIRRSLVMRMGVLLWDALLDLILLGTFEPYGSSSFSFGPYALKIKEMAIDFLETLYKHTPLQSGGDYYYDRGEFFFCFLGKIILLLLVLYYMIAIWEALSIKLLMLC